MSAMGRLNHVWLGALPRATAPVTETAPRGTVAQPDCANPQGVPRSEARTTVGTATAASEHKAVFLAEERVSPSPITHILPPFSEMSMGNRSPMSSTSPFDDRDRTY